MKSLRYSSAMVATVMTGLSLLAVPSLAFAKATQGELYLDGHIVGTTVNSAAVHDARDPLYAVTNGVSEQLGVAGVGPGDAGYHGGEWAVYLVTFADGVTPYLLTSDEDVLAAQAAGDVTVTRSPDKDFRCPVTQQNS